MKALDNISAQRFSLLTSLKDVELLLETYELSISNSISENHSLEIESAPYLDQKAVRAESRSYRFQLKVLLRSSIILIMSAWEFFIESALETCFLELLNNANDPTDIQSAFNNVAHTWYDNIKSSSSQKPKPEDFANWTGSRWKKLLHERFNQEIERLNTPSATNIDKLSKKYLGLILSDYWHWKNVSKENAQKKLENLINLRGKLAHTQSRDINIRIQEVKSALNLITNISVRTEKALNLPITNQSIGKTKIGSQ